MDNLTAASFRALPDEAPLAMPTQSLRTMRPARAAAGEFAACHVAAAVRW